MSEGLHFELPEDVQQRDPSLVVATADGRLIYAAEFYDEAFSGWSADNPYVEMSDLEDAMASGHGHGSRKKREAAHEPFRETELYVSRTVVQTPELTDVLVKVSPFAKEDKTTRCLKPGDDIANGLHSTVFNTQGKKGIILPEDREEFLKMFPARVPLLGRALGSLSIDGVKLFSNGSRHHVALIFGSKAHRKLRDGNIAFDETYFPARGYNPDPDELPYVPHVTILSTDKPDIAEQAFRLVDEKARMPKAIELRAAKAQFYEPRFSDPTC